MPREKPQVIIFVRRVDKILVRGFSEEKMHLECIQIPSKKWLC